MSEARKRAYAINGEIWYSVVSSKVDQLHLLTCAQVVTELVFAFNFRIYVFYFFRANLLIVLPLSQIILISSENYEEVTADIQTKTTTKEFTTNDKANYYSWIASIMVNGKRAYGLKDKFLDDLNDNAFSGTNGEDAVEHIKHFLKIVDPINLPNVNYEQLRLSVFLILLVGNTSKWFNEFKAIRDPSNSTFEKWLASNFANHMIMDPFTKKVLWDFWIKNYGQEGVADEEFCDAEKANNDDEQKTAKIFRIETNLFDYETPLCIEFKEFNFLLKVDLELFTHDIEITKTYEDYENELNDEIEEPWSEDGVPFCDHICEPFRFKSRKAKWPTCNSNEEGFCNRG
nr:hypothetical protein [Tanacetum cinerariifolium]